MEQALPDTISLNLADIEQTISFRTRAEPILNLEIFDALAKAVAQRQQLELQYRKPGQQSRAARRGPLSSGEHQRRMVSVCLRPRAQGHPHLCPGANSIGQADRQDLRASAEIFAGETAARQFWRAFRRGRIRSRHPVQRRAPPITSAKRNGIQSQQLRELKDGGVELKLKLSSLARSRALGLELGRRCKSFEAGELAEAVRKAAKAILQHPR